MGSWSETKMQMTIGSHNVTTLCNRTRQSQAADAARYLLIEYGKIS